VLPLSAIGSNGNALPDPPPSKKPEIPARIILGHATAHYRDPATKEERTILDPGDAAVLTVIAGEGDVMRPVNYRYVVSDYYKTEMSEYDSQYVFVPLQHLQELRSLQGRVSTIQVKLKNYDRDAKEVKQGLTDLFGGSGLYVQTWEDKQGPLLAAIGIERGILNVILFMIVGVAGFGILAIFSMIVAEKTRDIGVLKALGASNRGVMGIFLGYGLLLGVVGAVLGTAIGMTVTIYINEIEQGLAKLTGHELFDRTVYYFKDIPTDMQPMSLVFINAGAIAIAVVFSIIPALRAAWLRPVQALRYE
jgi:lipoprotein-releasing system permease protein